MTRLDRFLQHWRIRKARPFIQPGDRVLDLGSADGVLFQQVRHCGPGSMGIDPTLDKDQVTRQGFRLVKGFFPADLPANNTGFDVIVMLAVLEHFPPAEYPSLTQGCARLLREGGRLVITVPSPLVDNILTVLIRLGLVHGMSLEEHHGYNVDHTPGLFAEPHFRLRLHEVFQLGLNHLFVFERTGTSPSSTPAITSPSNGHP